MPDMLAMSAIQISNPIVLVILVKSDDGLIHGFSNERRSGNGRKMSDENIKRLCLKQTEKLKEGTHKKEGSLRPEIILGRIDLLKNSSLCILRVQIPAHPCGWSKRPYTTESISVD